MILLLYIFCLQFKGSLNLKLKCFKVSYELLIFNLKYNEIQFVFNNFKIVNYELQ